MKVVTISSSQCYNLGLWKSWAVIDCSSEAAFHECRLSSAQLLHAAGTATLEDASRVLAEIVDNYSPEERGSVILYGLHSPHVASLFETAAQQDSKISFVPKLWRHSGLHTVYVLPEPETALFKASYPFLCNEDLPSNVYPGLVEPNLFLGSYIHAKSADVMTQLGITAIVNCCASEHDTSGLLLNHDENYLALELKDDTNQQLMMAFQASYQFLQKKFANKQKVLVHCHQGKSRSAAIVMGYLQRKYGMSTVMAFTQTRAARAEAQPNPNFFVQLQHHSTTEHESKRTELKGHDGLHVLCFGDSLTGGYFQFGCRHVPYSEELCRLLKTATNLPQNKVKVDTDGVDGRCAVNEMTLALPYVLKEEQYDIVVILGGTNDLNPGDGAATRIFEEGLQRLHNTAWEHGARTLAVTLPDIAAVDDSPRMSAYKAQHTKLNTLIKTFVQNNASHVSLLDLNKLMPYHAATWEQRQLWWDDGLHFTELGYVQMGRHVFAAIIDMLS